MACRGRDWCCVCKACARRYCLACTCVRVRRRPDAAGLVGRLDSTVLQRHCSPARVAPAGLQEVRGAQLEAARLAGELEAVRASMAELEAGRAADRAELAQARALNSALQAQVGGPRLARGGPSHFSWDQQWRLARLCGVEHGIV